MCRPAVEGGRRCVDTRRLRTVPLDQLRPAPAPGRDEVAWPPDTAAAIVDRHGGAGAQALALLVHLREQEPQVTADFLAALPTGARAAGLAFRVKSPTSLARKIADRVETRHMSPAAAAEQCQDVLRYTAVATTPGRLVPTARRLVDRLLERGWRVREAQQSYVNSRGRVIEGQPYRGLHLVMERAGVACEVQIHSEQSHAIVLGSHLEYERERDPAVSRAQRARARAVMERRWAAVTTPRGLGGLSELGGVPVTVKQYPNPYKRTRERDAT